MKLDDLDACRHRFDGGLYVRERPASGTSRGTLLYVHGLGESGFCFESLMAHPRLAAFRQVAVDLPGYGKTPWRQPALGLDEHAALLVDWLERHVPEPLVVVGHSMGGVVATLLIEKVPAPRRGERIRGFVNVEGNVSFADCGFSGKVAAHDLAAFVDGELDRLLEGLYRDGLEDAGLRTYYPSLRFCDPRAYHRSSVDLVELSRTEGLAARMAALGVPVVYLLGHPRGTGEHSRGLLDRAGVPWRAIDETGHWPFIERPDAFAEPFLAFLDGLSP